MKVWTNDVDTVVAVDLSDVKTVLVDVYGADYVDYWDAGEWQEREDKPLTIANFDGHDNKATRSNAEWIASDGRGLLCSTEY